MMAFLRNLTIVLALGLLVNLGVMALPGHLANAWRVGATTTPIPDPPPLPCSKQSWPNADRVCLSWTAPREALPAAAKTAANANRAVTTGSANHATTTGSANRTAGTIRKVQ
jgi:hypothetical protein